jgi:hypothetical protein
MAQVRHLEGRYGSVLSVGGEPMTTPVECVILDIPDGLRLDLLGLVVEVGRVRIVADRAGLLGGLLASLTCGGPAAADRLEAMARVMRAEDGSGQGGGSAEQEPARAS